MGSYCLPYLFLWITILFCYIIEKSHSSFNKISYVVYVILLLFIGLRGFVMTDYMLYYPFFENLAPIYNLEQSNFEYAMEPGFIIYSSLIKTVVPNYHAWVFINTLIDITVFYFFFKKYCKSAILPFLFFIAYYGIILEFNTFRNVKAILFFIWALPYIKERRIKPFLVIILLGAMFHFSILTYIIIYPIYNYQFTRKQYLAIVIILISVYVSGINISSIFFNTIIQWIPLPISTDKLLLYLYNAENNIFSLGFLERTITIFICIYYSSMLIKISDFNRIFINCLIVYYAIFCLFSDVKVFTERFPLLFAFSYWIVLANLIELKCLNKRLLTMYILAIAMLRIIVDYKTETNYYDNLLWGIRSIEVRQKVFNEEFKEHLL